MGKIPARAFQSRLRKMLVLGEEFEHSCLYQWHRTEIQHRN